MLNFLRKQMKWVMAVIVVAFLLSTFLMYEGRGTRRTPGRNADGTMTDYEVANINGRSLMRSELERRLRDYLSTYSSRSTLSIDMPALYQSVLDQAILESQLTREVEASGIRVSDADADRAMKEYADMYYPTREAFYQVLAQSGVKVEDYKKTLARQMAVEQLLRNAVGDVVISEDKAQEFYDTMKNLLYFRPEGYNVHIADFRTSRDAEVLYTKLVAGESWDVIASNDELASQDVINITKSPIFLPTSTFTTGALSVLASLDVGQPSPVFTMSSGDYAVAMKTAHVDDSVTPYEEVSGDIRTLLTTQEERNRLTAYQTSLREKANVVINDQELFARPAVSEDNTPEVIPEITIDDQPATDQPATDQPAPAEETTPETAPAPAEEPEAAPEPVEETPAETPAPAEEATPEPETTPAPAQPEETTAPAEEATTTPEATAPAETAPEPMAETAPTEEPAPETTPEPETPATQEAAPETPEATPAPAVEETPAPEVTQPEATPEPETTPAPEVAPEPEATPAPTEEPAPAVETPVEPAEVITEPENIPVQEEITEEVSTPEEVEEVHTEPVIDKTEAELPTSSDAE